MREFDDDDDDDDNVLLVQDVHTCSAANNVHLALQVVRGNFSKDQRINGYCNRLNMAQLL